MERFAHHLEQSGVDPGLQAKARGVGENYGCKVGSGGGGGGASCQHVPDARPQREKVRAGGSHERRPSQGVVGQFHARELVVDVEGQGIGEGSGVEKRDVDGGH